MSLEGAEEISLFDATPTEFLYRNSDPGTSRVAAESLDVNRLEQMVYEAIASTGTRGMTQDDLLETFASFAYSSITARPAALKRKGLVAPNGETRKGRSGRPCKVLVATKFLALESDDRSNSTDSSTTHSPACDVCGQHGGQHQHQCPDYQGSIR